MTTPIIGGYGHSSGTGSVAHSRRGYAAVVQRVIVIGAGQNGLLCAAELARAGLDVTVVDQADKIGGGVGSAELTLPGFVHDTCAAFMPVAHASPAMLAQPVERYGVDWINPEAIVAHPFEDGTACTLHRDLDATAASLNAVGAGSGDAWRVLLTRVLPHGHAFAESIFSRLPPVRPAARLVAGLRRDLIDLTQRMLGSAEALGQDLFRGERPTAWLAGASMHSGLPPSAAGSGAFGFLLMMLGHLTGWPFPRGGSQQLADALAAHARDCGVEIRLGASVEQVAVRNGRATGVELAGGDSLSADAVVATITAGPLARLVPEDAMPARTFRRLRAFRYGVGVFKVDYALTEPMPWAAEDARRAAVVHLAGELRDLSRSTQQAQRGDPPERPAMVVGQQSLYDDSRAPDGQHTLYAYTHTPPDIGVPADEMVDRMEAQFERFAPGFRNKVLGRHVRTPRELEQQNPSMVNGDLAGGSFELDQQLIFRPAPELSRYRTPLRGLYVGSASTHPGGATHGVPGREAARSLLRDRGPLRFWR